METTIGKSKIKLVQGDITDQETEAIVNAANPSPMGGGGVDGAIHRKGGPNILEECKKIRNTEWPEGLPTGKAVITSSGKLKAQYVIHSVGPIWRGRKRDEPRLLSDAYWNSLELAVSKELKTIAFPSISTGAYAYPVENASRIALKTVKSFLEEKDGLEEVRFVLFNKSDLETHKDAIKEML